MYEIYVEIKQYILFIFIIFFRTEESQFYF